MCHKGLNNEIIVGYVENWESYDSEIKERIIKTIEEKMGKVGLSNLKILLNLWYDIEI